jgi:hypothetical protein
MTYFKYRLIQLLQPATGDSYLSSLLGKQFSRSQTNATAAACDDGYFVV